jgi:FKBP-type peptidyl-prolyl cis-trans isomerase SlyD
MNIANKLYVAFDYKLTLDSGEEIDSSSEGQPLGFITGSGQIIPGLEKAMMGMKVGDSLKISVEPENAYGQVNPELFQDIPRNKFPGEIELQPGMTFQAQGPQGPIAINIREIKDEDTVVIDLNHPLAGKKLHFDLNIVEVREPTAEELSSLSSGCNCGCSAEEQADCGTKGGCC